MVEIINPVGPASPYPGIADSLRDIGQSIWGNGARNEGVRQHARKLAAEAAAEERKNSATGEAAERFAQGDWQGVGRNMILAGEDPKIPAGYTQYYNANKYGADDPRTTNSMMGVPGANYAHTPSGFREGEATKLTREGMRDTSGGKPTFGVISQRPDGTPEYGWRNPAQIGAPGGGVTPYVPGEATPQPGFGAPASGRPGVQNIGLFDEGNRPIPLAMAGTGHVQSAIRGELQDEAGNPLISPQGAAKLAEIHQRDPGHAGHLLATIQGRIPPLSPAAWVNRKNGPFVNDLFSIAPGFDAGVWGQRFKTYQDYATSGGSGKAAQAAEQALRHGRDMIETAGDLNNFEPLRPFSGKSTAGRVGNFVLSPATQAVNATKNAYNEASGEPGPTAFDVLRDGFSDEFAKAFKGAGVLNEKEVEGWQKNFNARSKSPTQMRAAVSTALSMLDEGMKTREAQRNRVLGPNHGQAPMLSPEAHEKLNEIAEWARTGKLPAQRLTTKVEGRMPQGAPQPAVGEPAAPGAPQAPPGPQNVPAASPGASQPPPAAIEILRARPDTAEAFDRHYGAGAAAAILGAR